MNPTDRIAGISGIFIAAKNPKQLQEWYSRHLGIEFVYWDDRQSYGTEFIYRDEPDRPASRESTVFVIEPSHGAPDALHPTVKLQYRVADLSQLVGQLSSHGVEVERRADFSYGRFAWLTDLEGNRVELYQPL